MSTSLSEAFPPSLPPSITDQHSSLSRSKNPESYLDASASPSQLPLELQDLYPQSHDPNSRFQDEEEDEEYSSLEHTSRYPQDTTSPTRRSEEVDTPTPHMNRKSRSKKGPRVDSPARQSKESTYSNGDMSSSPLEHRRKHNPADGNPSSATLLSGENFSLDTDPDDSKEKGEDDAHGFFDLPQKDRRNFLLLVLLYFLQGIPMGLAGGSVPFLLKSAKYGVSYGQIGVFSLASYPYSLKLLWSPIVDAVWSQRIGRRKSWILPVQVFSGLGMLWLGSRAEEMMASAGADGGAGIWGFTGWWFFLVFTCATQDIAVDGWAITILSQKHLSYASTAQTVGLTGGSFLSFTVFLAFSDPHFANKWFRSPPPPGMEPSQAGLWTLGGYLIFWGWAYLLVTIGMALLKREDKTRDREGILDVYKVMLGILKLKNIQTIIIIHLIAKIGFQANDAVTNLKLLDKGFGQDNMSLVVLIDFPFELSLGYYAGKWSSTYGSMHLWCWAFIGRLFAAAFAQVVVMIFPAGGVTTWYLLTVIVEHVMSTFMNTIMFVAISAFHAKIADPIIGGTYMTLLATVSNLGGTFPKYFVLKLVDSFTVATCVPPTTPPSLKGTATAITHPFSCVQEPDRNRCTAGGGTCTTEFDGYYVINVACIIFGAVTFIMYIRPRSLMLQDLPLKAWRLEGTLR